MIIAQGSEESIRIFEGRYLCHAGSIDYLHCKWQLSADELQLGTSDTAALVRGNETMSCGRDCGEEEEKADRVALDLGNLPGLRDFAKN